jgi:hypothetical protein
MYLNRENVMSLKPTRRQRAVALSVAICVSILLAPAVVTAEESEGWRFRITPYLWALSLDGTTAALGSDVPVDADFGDILDLLNIALSANMELGYGRFFAVLDPMWADLEAGIKTDGPIGGDVEIQLFLVDGLVGFNVTKHFDLYTGFRYYDQDITIVPDRAPEIDLGDEWTDFLIGFRLHADIAAKWSVSGKLDAAVAGDSDSAWYAQVMFARHFGSNKHLDVGYRHYDVDYESGSGLSRFKWDVAHSGPVVGFSWEF